MTGYSNRRFRNGRYFSHVHSRTIDTGEQLNTAYLGFITCLNFHTSLKTDISLIIIIDETKVCHNDPEINKHHNGSWISGTHRGCYEQHCFLGYNGV
jgi:hypothetical protein